MIKYNIMYKPMSPGNRRFYVTIVILATFFLFIYGSYSYGAAQTDETGKTFKSEEELIDQTRQEVEKHINDNEEEVRVEPANPVEETPQEPQKPAEIKEENQAQPQKESLKEENQVKAEEKKAIEEEKIPAKQEKPPAIEEKSTVQSPQSTEKPDVVEEKQPAVEEKSAEKSDVVEENQSVVEEKPVVKQEDPPAIEEESTVHSARLPEGEAPAVGQAQSTEKPIVEQKQAPHIFPSANPSTDAAAKEVEAELGKGVIVTNAMEQPILRKMDVNKIGSSPYYETYEGLRLLKYFTVAQRVEIYQEPRPIDSYILDAFAMRIIYPNTPWNIDSDYRTQLVPIFTRAYGTEVTISDPKNKEGQIRYTHDYREIYKNYWPKYQYQNSHLKKEMWDQNEVLLMHSKDIEPLGWLYTSNLGYRYSTLSAKSDDAYYEVRHTYLGSLSVAPTDKTEYFFQGEYYKSMHLKASYDYRPDHFLGRTEIRIKSNDYKTMYVPQLSYSKDYYWPFRNTYQKYEIAFRVGRDWTKRFSTTTTVQYVLSLRDEPDNWGPNGYGSNNMNPHKDKAEYISLQNRFSYNVYDRLYLQLGLDFDNGLNWSIFDNWGLISGLEYYAPGMIRVDVGWRGNHYYNLDDYMSSIYFKFYLFM